MIEVWRCWWERDWRRGCKGGKIRFTLLL